ncbi:Bug family tripartite tricarboxylate transporter substrate binding protein [Candidimonas nitroreducens]|uniref:ABC transporter substrate-binding protein n=1 Tax=Candidimonas nitroreducens TaxID=683354 RepID=A0A225MKK2_9BURK|nr:tripartite tricarboxylate transporter substrate binding protein [Candidimonas nitroreducens]OWT61715.1 hypothetical protein CEY11_07665 [Candidimonas nitroreducens]
MKRNVVAICLLLLHALAFAAPDAYPSRPVHLLVGYPAGGAVDTVARLLAEKLGPLLGQPIVVENKPGATGNIAGAIVAHAPADGYTLYMGTSINAVSVSLFKKLSYDPVRDLAPVANVVEAHTVLASSMALPVKSTKELIAYAKAHPGRVTYASTGIGSTGQLSGVLFSRLADVQMLHVPYKGGPPALTDLLAGRVDIIFSNPVVVMPHILSGRIRALAVVASARLPELPDVPTMDELGYTRFDVKPWYGLMAPARTPEPIVQKINAAVMKIMKMPDVRDFLSKQGLAVLPPNTPAEFSKRFKNDVAIYAELIRSAGITPQ